MFPLCEEQLASKETGSAHDLKSPLLRPPGYEVGLNANFIILTHWSLFPLSVNFERGMVARPMNSSAPTWSLSHMSRSSVWSIASSTTADQSSFHTGWRLLFTTWSMIHEGAFNVSGLISCFNFLPSFANVDNPRRDYRRGPSLQWGPSSSNPWASVSLLVVMPIYIYSLQCGKIEFIVIKFCVCSLLSLPCLHKGYP